jgi:hypothetical protein
MKHPWLAWSPLFMMVSFYIVVFLGWGKGLWVVSPPVLRDFKGVRCLGIV